MIISQIKKILIITYYWPPSGGAGVQRWLKFSKYLPEFGCTPVILTVDENQASYAQLDHSLIEEINLDLKVHKTRTFEPYNLYRRLAGKKEIPYGGFSNQKKITLFEKFSRLVRGNLFVPDPRRGWNKYALRKALELIKYENIESVITSGPPHSTHLIGQKIKDLTGIRWIADFRDPWTDIYYYKELYHSLPARLYDRSLEKMVLSGADKIITVSEEVKKLLLRKIPGSEEKIAVIPNGYDESDFENVAVFKNEFFTITYTGTISMSYRIEQFIGAIDLLPAEVKTKIKIRFVGNVPDEILNLFKNKNLGSMVEVLGYIPHKEAVVQMVSASLLLMAIPDSPDNKGIVTGKFFEYLAAKRPILAMGPVGGDVDLLIQRCNAGKLFSYNEIEPMSLFILKIFEQEQNGSYKCETTGAEQFTRRNLTEELANNL
ncbi:MAG: glycosyltransferase family 4 protein [Bacteroidia bacterium]|nr:glycosyltransferase family 4 protein [Bacteroidia bacterium]